MRYRLRKFNPETDTRKPFDCGNPDLNGFLLETDPRQHNATMHAKEMLSETYVAVDISDNILAYFSLLNDKIDKNYTDKRVWNRLSRAIPNAKRRSSQPALKIGRFAVSKNYQKSGLGKELIRIIQIWFFKERRAGCRFITVDALECAVGFYKKCNFNEISQTEKNEPTTTMCFDLKSVQF